MLRSVVSLIKSDLDSQAQWMRQEAGRQGRSAAITVTFALAAAISALGLSVIGLLALYVWAEEHYGPLAALGLIGAVLAAATLIFVGAAFLRSAPKPAQRPEIRSADPAALKLAVAADARAGTDEALRALRQSSLGPAISAGEQAFQAGDRLVRSFDGFRGKSSTTLLVALGATALIGAILGRRL